MESFTVLEPTAVIAHAPRAHKGFTLIEMLVVLGIISIISAIAVTGQSTFNQSLLLTNTAYTVAFSAREAQSFGLSSRKFGNVQNAGYGLHFDRALPTSYILFADIVKIPLPTPSKCPVGTANAPDQKLGNCAYDSGGDGIQETFTFSRGFKIQKFCGTISGIQSPNNRFCSTNSTPLSTLDIVFTRPNTASVISGNVAGLTKEFSCAEITITDGGVVANKTVRVSTLGEISIGATCPP
ncbi:MAG: putative Type pilus pilin [Parcubacteria group bacterium]|nr:putative Type pilus pilin [Parcubacteria group bacterium]